MRIAIATDGTNVSLHFGRCSLYTIIDVDDGIVIERNILKNPGHQPNFLPQFLHDHGVDCIMSGGMGQKARALFDQHNIQAIVGVEGDIESVIDAVLNDEIEGGENLCHPKHEHAGHEHGHEHHQ